VKRKIFSLLLTVLIFVLIFRNIDIESFLNSIPHIRVNYLFFALAYFLIYPFVGIERWRVMIQLRHSLGFWEAFKIYFIGETLNMALPSKAGDLSKAYFLKKGGICTFSFGMSSVVFEKLLDLISLGFAFILGFIFLRAGEALYTKMFAVIGVFILLFFCFLFLDRAVFIKRWLYALKGKRLVKSFNEVTAFVKIIKARKNLGLLLGLISISILFWLGHLFQIFLFFRAANMNISYWEVLFYVPVAILVALIPITIGGMGTRDLTLLGLLSSFIVPETIVLGGLLISLRYFIPALFGLLFIKDALEYIRAKKSEPVSAQDT